MRRKPRATPVKRARTRVKVKNDLGGGTRKIWSVKDADKKFSLYIRERDGRCMYKSGTYSCPVTEINKLQCSHYHGRARSSTRYDPKNCIALCWKHHFQDKLVGWEYAKQNQSEHGFEGKYTTFMKQWLGSSLFNELYLRSKQYMSRDNAIIQCMKLLKAL